ncbi:uridine kinase family protein [Xylanimonas cellulosilytica]|uniref:uridine kinase family protein n=1 Tax=Xylanimonas cellulosilytica TaxID=186189 RepID=UPI00019C03DA|nr:hypothetical protein [Xylanimonas cellulosilytica]
MEPEQLGLPRLAVERWETTTVANVAAGVVERARVVEASGGGRRHLVVVDGDGGSGKTTFARRLVAALPGSGLVHVDDVSWWLDWTDWTDAMLDGVVRPWLSGTDVDYRPPGWIAKGREGSVRATAARFLVLEGVGAGRRELAPYVSYAAFVTADPLVAQERILVRDIGTDGDTRDEVFAFYADSQRILVPFLLDQRPWERADLIVDGDHDAAGNDLRVARGLG